MPVTHDTFVIERTSPHPAAEVVRAWADPEVKRQWLHGPAEWDTSPHETVGGGTRPTRTEQGAYVDPEDESGPAGRLEGTEGLLEQLADFLDG